VVNIEPGVPNILHVLFYALLRAELNTAKHTTKIGYELFHVVEKTDIVNALRSEGREIVLNHHMLLRALQLTE
jgi:hypothetical protein